jgi:proline iminopeptidase
MAATTDDKHLTEGYEHDPPFDSGFLSVGSIHKIYYAQHGNPSGKPAIFLHGGPGGQTSLSSTIFFDPAVYRVVLLDQRGAGKSEPAAELRENTSQHLVADIEALRSHLGIEKWHTVFGGSWGSTLSLLYAETHPERVGSLVLRGIFTVRESEKYFTRGFNGTAHIFPELFEEWVDFLPEEERKDPYQAYLKRLTSEDYETRVKAARAWNKWELGISRLLPYDDAFENLDDDRWNLQHARMEVHYETNGAFLEEGQLLKPENIERIRHIPCISEVFRWDGRHC